MQSFLQALDVKMLEIKDKISYKNFNSYKNSLSILSPKELVDFFKEYTNDEINYALSEIYKKYSLYDNSSVLSSYVHHAFNSSSDSLKLTNEELEYLLDLLEETNDLDESFYEEILKINFNYKYKERIEKLLSRKKKQDFILNVKPTFNKDNLYKLFLSVMNNNVKTFYNLSLEEYFSNISKQEKICDILTSLGYKYIVDDIKEIFKNNDYNKLQKIISGIDIKDSDYNKFILATNEKEAVENYDFSQIKYNEANISFEEFIKSQNLPFDLFKESIDIVEKYFHDDLINDNINFSDAISNKKDLEYILLTLKDKFKNYGFVIDFDFIKNDIKNIDYIKEMFILKSLYRILNIVKFKNVDLSEISTKEDMFSKLKEINDGKEFNNLAEKLNQKDISKEDLRAVLLFMAGSNEISATPKKEVIDFNIEKDNLSLKYNLNERVEEINKTDIKELKETYEKYFTDLKKLDFMSKGEIEAEITFQLAIVNQKRLLDLLEPDIFDYEFPSILEHKDDIEEDLQEPLLKVENALDEAYNLNNSNHEAASNKKDVKELIERYKLIEKFYLDSVQKLTEYYMKADLSPEETQVFDINIDKIMERADKFANYRENLEVQERININVNIDDNVIDNNNDVVIENNNVDRHR